MTENDPERVVKIISDGDFAILDNNKCKDGISFLFHGLQGYVTANRPSQVRSGLAEIEAFVERGGYAVGYFSYELGYCFQERLAALLSPQLVAPLFCVGLFERRLAVPDATLAHALTELTRKRDSHIVHCRSTMTREEYLKRLARVQEHISDGDTYQVNYTIKYKFSHVGCPLRLYADLRHKQRVEYGAFLDFPDLCIVSRSPELFIEKIDDRVRTKPMKGTAGRGRTEAEDAQNIWDLQNDEKTRAENVMIVDLLRNDISRIGDPASVETSGLFEVQTFETLHQMISTVSANVPKSLSITKVLEQMFPCGSITGAPKVRTMEIIHDLESEPRGVYTGSIGQIEPNGNICLNVAIRTLALRPDGTGEAGVGGGIVHDSISESEYAECLLKGRFFADAATEFGLIECIRYDGKYVALEAHIDRLRNSAHELGFQFDLDELRSQLTRSANEIVGPTKVRVVLARNGQLTIERSSIEDSPSAPKRITIAPVRVDSAHWALRHKTTLRSLQDRAYSEYGKPGGYYDVVFLNEHGHVAEGTYNNIFVRKGSMWLTPPLESGLLPGIKRQLLLESDSVSAQTAILTPQDLVDADEIAMTNAIRGMVRVQLGHRHTRQTVADTVVAAHA